MINNAVYDYICMAKSPPQYCKLCFISIGLNLKRSSIYLL